MNCMQYWTTQPRPAPPFTRILALGWYDGPTGGVAECVHCGGAYLFEMLDWDDWQDVRIFGLAPLPAGSFEALVSACPKSSPPRWPVWSPLWVFPSEDEREEAERQVRGIEQSAGRPDLVAAWEDDQEGVLAARMLAEEDLPEVKAILARGGAANSPAGGSETPRDWFAFLGLERKRGGLDTDDDE
jgi:hypothetical protein